jgi:hypothetical protein
LRTPILKYGLLRRYEEGKMKYSSITRLSGSPSVEECLKDAFDILRTTKHNIEFDFNGVEFLLPYFLLDSKPIEYLIGWYSCLYRVLQVYKIDLKKWSENAG